MTLVCLESREHARAYNIHMRRRLLLLCLCCCADALRPVRPGRSVRTRSRAAATTMQFDEETGRKPQSAQVPPLSPSVNPPADDEANVERGVRILGFCAGGFAGKAGRWLSSGPPPP